MRLRPTAKSAMAPLTKPDPSLRISFPPADYTGEFRMALDEPGKV